MNTKTYLKNEIIKNLIASKLNEVQKENGIEDAKIIEEGLDKLNCEELDKILYWLNYK